MCLEFLFNVRGVSSSCNIVPIKCGLAINWVSFAGPSRHSGCAALAERFTAAAVRVSVEWGSGGGEGGEGQRERAPFTIRSPSCRLISRHLSAN